MILDEINLQPIPNQEIYYQNFRIRIYQANSAMAMDLYKDGVAIFLGLRLVNGGLTIPYPALTSDVEGGTSGVNFLLDCSTDDIPDYTKFGTEQKLYAFREEDLYEFEGDVYTPANDLGEFGGIDMNKPSPVLSYDFSTMLSLHSDWALIRASDGVYYDVNGDVQSVGNNLPRFTSFETGGPQAGILIEGSSTNMVGHSFYGTGWGGVGGSVTNNFADTNFPGLKSLKLTCTGNGIQYYMRPMSVADCPYVANNYYIASVYFRPGVGSTGLRQFMMMDDNSGPTNPYIGMVFDVTTMQFTSNIGALVGYRIIPLPNGVYRLVILGKAVSTTAGRWPLIWCKAEQAVAGESFECWGFQLEETTSMTNVRNGASAPITTTGTAMSSPSDSLRIEHSVFQNYKNIDNFSIYTEFYCDVLGTNTYIPVWVLYQSSPEQLLIRIGVNMAVGIWTVQFHRISPSIPGNTITISPNLPISTLPSHFKVATSVRNGNEISVAVNGMVFHGVMDAALLPSTQYQLRLASQYSLSTTVYKKVDYYDTALSNEVMQQMTGL